MKKASNKNTQFEQGFSFYQEIIAIGNLYQLKMYYKDGSNMPVSTGRITKTAKGYSYHWRDVFGDIHKSYLNPKVWDIEE